MPKKEKSWNEFNILRALIIISIIIYILGIVPQFTEGVKALFANPLMKIVFLALIVLAGYLDSTIGILLAVAFILSYLSTPEYKASPVFDVLDDVQRGTGHIIGGVGEGAQRLVGSVGSTAKELVGGVSAGTQQVIGGVQRGTQRIAGGLGAGTSDLLRGAEGGVQQVVGGLGRGAQELVGSAQVGTQQLISGLQESTQQAIGGFQKGTQQLLGESENMTNSPTPSISQIYQQHMENQSEKSNCNVQPAMTTGCDPIVGYNAPYNCGCSGACGGNCKGLDPACLCKGVQVWKDELNAQGLNHPIGYAGSQVGSSY